MRLLTKREFWEERGEGRSNSAEDKAMDSKESKLLQALPRYLATKVVNQKDAIRKDANANPDVSANLGVK